MTALKIAVILPLLPNARNTGGVGYAVHRLCNILAQHGHVVTVFTLSESPRGSLYEVRQLPQYDVLDKTRWARLYVTPWTIGQVDFTGYDVIHAHGGDCFMFANHVPVVRTFWGSALGEALRSKSLLRCGSQLISYPLEWLSGVLATECVAISRSTQRHLPFIRSIVPCGVDLIRYKPGREKADQPTILYVAGSIHGRKRGRFMLDIFQHEVRPRLKSAQLWMVCKEEVRGDGVVWMGAISTDREDELIALYQRAWVFCLPSSYEGFGIPYIEAMACDTAVVASPNIGALEVLAGGEFGVIAKDKEIGWALYSLLSDSERRQGLAEKCRGHVERYGLSRMCDAYEAIYRTATKDR